MVYRLGSAVEHDPWLSDERRSLSLAATHEVLNRVVNGLDALGLRPGEPIAVFVPNAMEVALVHVAGLYAGVPTVPISALLGTDEVVHVLRDSGAGALFVGDTTVSTGVAAAADVGVPHVFGWRAEAEPSVRSWEHWLAAEDFAEPSPDRPGARIIFYTSGTTGLPKGTLSRLPGMPETVRGVVDVWLKDLNVTVGPHLRRLMNVGPMHHIAPLGSCIGGTMACGLVALPRFDAQLVLETIEREQVGSTVMVPTHLRRLLHLPEDVRARFDVSSVELIGLTGAACPADVKQAIIDWFGPVVIEAYGATEAGALCRIDSNEWLAHRGSVGRCLPDFEPVVLDADDRPLPRGQVGRLYFRDRLGLGIDYRNAPEKTAAAHLEPGVFTIGDVGYVDDEGYVYITDRAVDMIVSGGVNVYPAEAERVLVTNPSVRDVAVIAVPDDDLGERAHALVEPMDPAAPPDPEALVAFCKEHLAHYKCPRTVEFVPSVGRTAMGKLDKRTLRAPYWPTDRTIGG